MSAPYLSVVLPCYNESENLRGGVLVAMQRFLDAQPWDYEVIISDDGSRDDSLDLARAQVKSWPQLTVLSNPHRGKPSAVWAGIQAARGEIVLFADMDQSTPIHQVTRLLPKFSGGSDVVIGSRGHTRTNFAFYRRLGSMAFLTARRLLILPRIRDTQCGFKAMRREVALELFPRLAAIRTASETRGWKVTAFDVELLYLAEREGLRIAEVAVEWADRDLARGKGKSYLSESWEMARQVFRVKLNAWRGVYDDPAEREA